MKILKQQYRGEEYLILARYFPTDKDEPYIFTINKDLQAHSKAKLATLKEDLTIALLSTGKNTGTLELISVFEKVDAQKVQEAINNKLPPTNTYNSDGPLFREAIREIFYVD